MKKGILVVSFGTTYLETREKNIEAVVNSIRSSYSDCEVRQAYSGDKVRKILKERDNIFFPDIRQALEDMKESGIRQIVILPTHIIDGVENHKTKEIAEEFRQDFDRLSIADALLERDGDYLDVAKAMWDSLKGKAGERTVILMGHGTYHKADASYEILETEMREYSGHEIHIATVEGKTTIETVIKRMCGKKNSVLLTPFLFVAGEHARNDMAGEENSFYRKLTEAGFEVECLLKGIGEYKKMRDIYLSHLKRGWVF